MTQAKVCVLGAFAAGKTSLISRYVHNTFSEKYLTTVGVRIDRKVVRAGPGDLDLILWDMYGEDEFQRMRPSYLRGASGCALVVDGTRPPTLDTAIRLHEESRAVVGQVPWVYLINKVDLRDEWRIDDNDLDRLRSQGWPVILTSARTGIGVDEAFSALVGGILGTSTHD